MIVADLKHLEHQAPLTAGLRAAMEFLRRRDIAALADGRVEIDGDRVFALVQRYETVKTDSPKFEYHRKYIDVQFIASGEEIIGWIPREGMAVTEAYDEKKDICFGSAATGAWTAVRLEAGQAAVLWPEDGHAPKLSASAPSRVMKIVVKVAL